MLSPSSRTIIVLSSTSKRDSPFPFPPSSSDLPVVLTIPHGPLFAPLGRDAIERAKGTEDGAQRPEWSRDATREI